MKSASRHLLKISGLAILLAFGFAATINAQNREKYVISAKAGGINYVSGNVTVLPKGHGRERALTETDDLKTGDQVTTGAGGRVEVLLNPGSYLRVDENSEFELTDASLDHLAVRLVKGSAVVEASGGDGVELSLKINTPQTETMIIKGGIYRFNVLPNGTTEVLVRKGKLLYGKGLAAELKEGRKVLIGRGLMEVAKLDKKDQDSLDLWSKERAELLARTNQRLQRNTLLATFDNYDWNALNNDGMDRHGRHHGVWVYDAASRSYCFLPINSRPMSSPYGHNYGNGANPERGRHNWPHGDGSGSGRWSGGGSRGGSGDDSGGSSIDTSGRSSGGNDGGGSSSRGGNESSPSPQPAAESRQIEAAPSAPAPPPPPANDAPSSRSEQQMESQSRPNR